MKKKTKIWIYPLAIMGMFLMLTNSCKKKDANTEQVPVLTTSVVSEITTITATSGGNVTSDGGATVTARGVCWGTSANPVVTGNHTTDGTGTGIFTSSITGLTASTTYHYRAYATNSVGTSYGSDLTFTTLVAGLPTLTTTATSSITNISAVSGGNISSQGGSTITVRGVCWSTGTTPTITDSKTTDGTGIGNFTSAITGLNSNTAYNVRAYATNSTGTGYGSVKQFTTSQGAGTVTDADGNVYHTVTIGTQVWMVENLKVTKYKDSTAIPLVTDGTAWISLTTPGYCWYNNNYATYGSVYGALYNWYTVNTGNLCPAGWHVPTDAEWTTLTTFLSNNGGKLKEAGTAHWPIPNTGATNESGFTALPGGWLGFSGSFSDIQYTGYWWSATQNNSLSAWERELYYGNTTVGRNGSNSKFVGLSVRCIKD